MALTDKLTAIADAIRGKTGKTAGLTLEQMPIEIEGIQTGSAPDGTSVTFGNVDGIPVEREEAYAISSEDLNAIGAATQKMAGKSALLTIKEIAYWLNRVIFVPQSNAESSFSLAFVSGASGILPDVQRGTATSSFSLAFESSATGALQEE